MKIEFGQKDIVIQWYNDYIAVVYKKDSNEYMDYRPIEKCRYIEARKFVLVPNYGPSKKSVLSNWDPYCWERFPKADEKWILSDNGDCLPK